MIKVTLYETDSGKLYGFRMAGHAGYADRGKDIVCAAVSVLAVNTVNSIEQLTQERADVEENEDGFVSLRLDSRKMGSDALLLLRSLELGLKGIRSEYGKKYIQIRTERKQEV